MRNKNIIFKVLCLFPALVFMPNEIPQESFVLQPDFFRVSTSPYNGATLVVGALKFNLEEMTQFRSVLIAFGLMGAESTAALGDYWTHPEVLKITRTFNTALFMRANYTKMTLNVLNFCHRFKLVSSAEGRGRQANPT